MPGRDGAAALDRVGSRERWLGRRLLFAVGPPPLETVDEVGRAAKLEPYPSSQTTMMRLSGSTWIDCNRCGHVGSSLTLSNACSTGPAVTE
jgi:hypothetical protein